MDLTQLIVSEETEQTEFKLIWKTDWLKTICAFSNTKGGILLIGVSDSGKIVGVANSKKLIEDIPNTILNQLSIICSVELQVLENKKIILIQVKSSYAPVSFRGVFYARSGAVTLAMNGGELTKFLLKKYGKTWDDVTVDNFTIDDINVETIDFFKSLAKNRIPFVEKESDLKILLEKLNLFDGENLKRAAVLLFGKNSQKYFIQSHSKIGRFKSETNIISSDVVEGNLFQQVQEILTVLRNKYLTNVVSFDGIYRKEELEYPEPALREAIINALIHRDYTNNSNLQIKVYDTKLVLTNGADFPNQLNITDLDKPHPSLPTNPIIASVFYKAGLIENWGRGTINIIDECKLKGLPAPEYKYAFTAFQLTFFKRIDKNGLTDTVNDTVNDTANDTVNLTGRQVKIINIIKENNKLTLPQLASICEVSLRTITRDIEKLKNSGVLERIGSDKTGHWVVLNLK